MINKIIDTLKKLNIEEYLINDVQTESAELFFIKKNLDMHRTKRVHKIFVTVYRTFEQEGKRFKGDSNVSIHSTNTSEEVEQILKKAYEAAFFVKNPYYELPGGEKGEFIEVKSNLNSNSLAKNCRVMTEALFAADVERDVFLNSAELFVQKKLCRILNSKGIDVGYSKWKVEGEFVVQALEPQDVETHQQFSYNDLEAAALTDKVKRTFEMTRARANAVMTSFPEGLNVILSGSYMRDLFSFYLERASAGNIYHEYSNYSLGCDVKSDISIECKAYTPYSSEGIRMIDRKLVERGILKQIHGSVQNSYYLGVEPVGGYSDFKLEAGEVSLEDMKKEPYLHIVNFSDFQMDSMTGEFGGEIRLAFLYDGEKEIPITGGSINASIIDNCNNFVLSSDKLIEEGYEGPLAVCFKKLI